MSYFSDQTNHFVIGAVLSKDGSFIACYNLCCAETLYLLGIDTTTFLYKLLPCYDSNRFWSETIKFEHHLCVAYSGKITNVNKHYITALFPALMLPLEDCLT